LDILGKSAGATLYFNIKYEAYKRLFESNDFKLVLTVDENTPNNKSILDAAKFSSVFTMAYQHGSVHRLNPSYNFHPNDESFLPFPDMTLVWDEYAYQYLVSEANYPKSKVKIIGQLKTDIIPLLKKSVLVDKFRQNIDSKNILLFASQPLRDRSMERRIVDDLFQVIGTLEDVHLIFRPHPRETENEWVDEIAIKNHCKNYSIDGASDLFLSLASVDAVITFFSTVGLEAQYFDKPLIIFDPLGQDPLGLVEKKIGIATHSTEGLKQAIIETLVARSEGDMESKGHLQTIDGLATERFRQEIYSHL
jgi:UDP-N-acetylglucosamine 2-epimerase